MLRAVEGIGRDYEGAEAESSPIDGTYGFGPAGLRFLGGGWSEGPIPMRSGTFSVSGDRLTLTSEDCVADGEYGWTLQAGVLSLTHLEDECYLRKSAVEREWTAIPSVEQAKEGDVALLPDLHPTNFFGQKDVANLESVTIAAHHAIVDDLLMLHFSPSSLVGAPGQTLQLTIQNREKSKSAKNGLIRHNFTLPEQGIDKDILPQESATVMVTFPQSGSLTFYCAFHVRLNHTGQLTVTG